MAPTVLRIGPYRFFFNSREETRRHVPVATAEGTAKLWLEPEVDLVASYNLSERELRDVEALVKEHGNAFVAAWNRHFGQ